MNPHILRGGPLLVYGVDNFLDPNLFELMHTVKAHKDIAKVIFRTFVKHRNELEEVKTVSKS